MNWRGVGASSNGIPTSRTNSKRSANLTHLLGTAFLCYGGLRRRDADPSFPPV